MNSLVLWRKQTKFGAYVLSPKFNQAHIQNLVYLPIGILIGVYPVLFNLCSMFLMARSISPADGDPRHHRPTAITTITDQPRDRRLTVFPLPPDSPAICFCQGRTSRRITYRTCLAPSGVRCQLAWHALFDGSMRRHNASYTPPPTLPAHTYEAILRLVLARYTSDCIVAGHNRHRHQPAGHDCHRATKSSSMSWCTHTH
jgi:hypothetical protein